MFNNKNIKVYNSLTNQLEDFKPIKENEVSMYVCGPTVEIKKNHKSVFVRGFDYFINDLHL